MMTLGRESLICITIHIYLFVFTAIEIRYDTTVSEYCKVLGSGEIVTVNHLSITGKKDSENSALPICAIVKSQSLLNY